MKLGGGRFMDKPLVVKVCEKRVKVKIRSHVQDGWTMSVFRLFKSVLFFVN